MKNDFLNLIVVAGNTANAINPINTKTTETDNELNLRLKFYINSFSEYEKNVLLSYYDVVDELSKSHFLRNLWIYKFTESTLVSKRYNFSTRNLHETDLNNSDKLKELASKLTKILIKKANEYKAESDKKLNDGGATLGAGNAGVALLGAFLWFAPWIAAIAAVAVNATGGTLLSEAKDLKNKAIRLNNKVSAINKSFSDLGNDFAIATAMETNVFEMTDSEKSEYKATLQGIINNCIHIAQQLEGIAIEIDDNNTKNQITEVENIVFELKNSIVNEINSIHPKVVPSTYSGSDLDDYDEGY
ncbi:hypothetical protein ACXYFN_00140 [Mycoplasma sp. 48589B]